MKKKGELMYWGQVWQCGTWHTVKISKTLKGAKAYLLGKYHAPDSVQVYRNDGKTYPFALFGKP